jgi:hypothetical protein
VRNNLERRIARLEERRRLAREQAALRNLIVSDYSPDGYFERLRAQLDQIQTGSTEERIAATSRELATLEADIAASRAARTDVQSRRLLEYCRREREIELLDLKGELSPEQLWAAREQASTAVRRLAPYSPIPTHERALELLESGTIGCHSFMPAALAHSGLRSSVTPSRRSSGHTEEAEVFQGFRAKEDDLDSA